MSQLIVLGSVNADHVVKVPSFSRPGETVHGHSYQVIAGGKGANQALAAARLGADIALISCVGDDDFGHQIKARYQDEGMDVAGIKIEQNCPTGIALIQVNAEGENSICIAAEANEKLTEQVVSLYLDKIKRANYLLMQLETPIEGVEFAAKTAKEAGVKVILNPAPAKLLPDSLLSNIDIITPNETEAQILTGVCVTDEQSAAEAAKVLHNKGIQTVLITLGAKGVYLSDEQHAEIIKGFKVKAIDTTAAGDTFNGAFVTGLLKDMPLTSAIFFAHAAAALSVTRFGAQTSIPRLEEVEQFLQTHTN